eukprot:3177588-Alexandrium_andersonii.AAC.1
MAAGWHLRPHASRARGAAASERPSSRCRAWPSQQPAERSRRAALRAPPRPLPPHCTRPRP